MLVIDEKTLEPIDSVSDGDGELIEAMMEFTAVWEVIEKAVTERRIVREYPNGGKDVETVVVSPEKGRWVVVGPGGYDVTGRVEVPSWASQSQSPVIFSETVNLLHRWLPGEVEEAEADGKRNDLIDWMIASDYIAMSDDAICELYEQGLDHSAIIDDQDAAICALYEMMEA